MYLSINLWSIYETSIHEFSRVNLSIGDNVREILKVQTKETNELIADLFCSLASAGRTVAATVICSIQPAQTQRRKSACGCYQTQQPSPTDSNRLASLEWAHARSKFNCDQHKCCHLTEPPITISHRQLLILGGKINEYCLTRIRPKYQVYSI